MSTVPTTYQGADKLSADARAALSCARLVWDGLTAHQRLVLQCAIGTGRLGGARLDGDVRGPTCASLASRGLVTRVSGTLNHIDVLTPLGLMVREAGTRTPKGAQ